MSVSEIDLNKIFHLDVTYNFDVLKTVLGGVLKTQADTAKQFQDLKNELDQKQAQIER